MEDQVGMDHLRNFDPLSVEWVTGLLLLVLVSLALINVSSPRKWRLLARSMFQMRIGRQTLRDEMDLQDRAFLGLLTIGVVVLALFAWQAIILAGREATYPELVGVVAGVVLGQYLLLWMIGGLLPSSSGIGEYLYTTFLIFILAGILLIPLVAFMAYQASWRYTVMLIGLGLLGSLLLYRWFRGVWIGLGEGIPLRYIILYFCAAEILPVLLALDQWRSTPSLLFHP